MTIFINTKLEKSDVQTNVYKYRIAANVTEYQIISKLNLLIIPNLFHVKLICCLLSRGRGGVV